MVDEAYEESDRNLTGSDGRLEKDVVTFNEEKSEITSVKEGHDVERVAANLKNLYCYERRL